MQTASVLAGQVIPAKSELAITNSKIMNNHVPVLSVFYVHNVQNTIPGLTTVIANVYEHYSINNICNHLRILQSFKDFK